MARTKAFEEKEVLAKAIDLFWDKGYHDTSMQDLVQHLGINRSSIYDTFGDKHALFLAALHQYRDQNNVQLNYEEIPDLRAYLKAFLHGLITEAMGDDHQKGCFMVNCSVEMASHDPEVREAVQTNMEIFANKFAGLFAYHQSSGQLPATKNPKALGNFLYGTISSIKMISRTTTDRKILDDIANTAVEAILN